MVLCCEKLIQATAGRKLSSMREGLMEAIVGAQITGMAHRSVRGRQLSQKLQAMT